MSFLLGEGNNYARKFTETFWVRHEKTPSQLLYFKLDGLDPLLNSVQYIYETLSALSSRNDEKHIVSRLGMKANSRL